MEPRVFVLLFNFIQLYPNLAKEYGWSKNDMYIFGHLKYVHVCVYACVCMNTYVWMFMLQESMPSDFFNDLHPIFWVKDS